MIEVMRTVQRGGKWVRLRDAVGEFTVVIRDRATQSVMVKEMSYKYLTTAKLVARTESDRLLAHYGDTASFAAEIYDMDESRVVWRAEENPLLVGTN